jgi:S1-C subfamily serine protease
MLKLGERTLEQPEDVLAATLEYEPGTRVPVEIARDGNRRSVVVELGRRPPQRPTSRPGG